MKKTYLLFTVQGYETMTPAGGLTDVVSLTVMAKTEAEALKRAKELVKKPNYRVASVTEYFYQK